jgi:hypothetical protein
MRVPGQILMALAITAALYLLDIPHPYMWVVGIGLLAGPLAPYNITPLRGIGLAGVIYFLEMLFTQILSPSSPWFVGFVGMAVILLSMAIDWHIQRYGFHLKRASERAKMVPS